MSAKKNGKFSCKDFVKYMLNVMSICKVLLTGVGMGVLVGYAVFLFMGPYNPLSPSPRAQQILSFSVSMNHV